MATHLRIATLALVTVLGAAACGGGTTIDTGNGEIQIDEDGGGVTFTDDEGNSVEVGTGVELPEDFPASFPLPDEVTPSGSYAAEGGFVVYFSTTMSFDDLVAFFDAELPANGWTIDTTQDLSDTSGSYRNLVISGNGYAGLVTIQDPSDASTDDPALIINLGPEQ